MVRTLCILCTTTDLYLFKESWCQTSLGVTFHSVGRVSSPTFRQTELQYWLEIGRLISRDLSFQYSVRLIRPNCSLKAAWGPWIFFSFEKPVQICVQIYSDLKPNLTLQVKFLAQGGYYYWNLTYSRKSQATLGGNPII